MTWEVYDPSFVASGSVATAKQPQSLVGKVVGLYDNTKDQADVILEVLGDELLKKHGVKELVKKKGVHYSSPMPPDMLADMAAKCDVVVCALGA